MKRTVLIISTVVIFAILNFAVYQKHSIKQEGETILLKLEPLDPRSLLQGNYMAFRYAIEDDMKAIDPEKLKNHRFAVISPDKQNVGQFVRLYDGESLKPEEKLIKYHFYPDKFQQIVIRPNSFLFQEDQQAYYQTAGYALFRYRGAKDYLLVGLADKQRKPL